VSLLSACSKIRFRNYTPRDESLVEEGKVEIVAPSPAPSVLLEKRLAEETKALIAAPVR
jgi:hypothetical protein